MSNTGALVYVVDDDACARDGVADLIRSAGLMVKTFASAEEFLTVARPKLPSCLVLDVKLPGVSGLDVQQELAKSDVRVPIIFLTGYGDIPMTVRAVKAGAVNVLTKPFDDEELLNAIRQCIRSCDEERLYLESETHAALGASHERVARTASADQDRARKDELERRARMVSEELGARMHLRIVGASAEWHEVLRKATQVAPTDTTVLITGESGTGKEVVARFVHRASARGSGPFVALNCAALPEQLLESELFGYERGAFTSAQQAKPGQIEMASGGVLFLDEVSEMSLSAQAKFLRVLQEREFQRLGATRSSRRTCALSPRPTGICERRSSVAPSARTCSTGWRCSTSTSPHCASAVADILPLAEAFLQEIAAQCRAAAGGIGGRRPSGAAATRLAGKRPRAPQCSRARSHPVRGRANRGEPPGAATVVRAGPRRNDQPEGRRARHHRAGAPAVPREQGAGGAASRPDANAAVCPAAQVRARADYPRGRGRGRVKEPPRRGDVHARRRPRGTETRRLRLVRRKQRRPNVNHGDFDLVPKRAAGPSARP